jgi:GxxExxY protein
VEDARTFAVIGAAMQVHRELGPGLREVSYQRALALEFEARGIPFVREFPIPISYRGTTVGIHRADFECGGILLEVKAVPFIPEQATAQLGQYLTASRHAVGLVLNFGTSSLHVKRVLASRGGATVPASESIR